MVHGGEGFEAPRESTNLWRNLSRKLPSLADAREKKIYAKDPEPIQDQRLIKMRHLNLIVRVCSKQNQREFNVLSSKERRVL